MCAWFDSPPLLTCSYQRWKNLGEFLSSLFFPGGVFTKDLNRAHRVIDAIDAGSCYVNNFNLAPAEVKKNLTFFYWKLFFKTDFIFQVPFGGFKMSGVGRENGTFALDFYTQVGFPILVLYIFLFLNMFFLQLQAKTVYVEMGDVDCGPLYQE